MFQKLVAIEPVSLVPSAEKALYSFAGQVVMYPDVPASDDEIIARIGDALSEAYFQTLEQILESPGFTYYHEWSPGDLILFDNRTVLHGREAYEGHRSLVQMQVKEAAV